MELRQLAYFVGVAEEGGFTRAAERARVAQPGVSAQIRRLEAELGQPLFDRTGGTVTLTAAGTAALPAARAALAGAAGVRHAVDELTGLLGGRVAIGVMPSTSYVFADPLARFAADHPRVEVTLREDVSSALLGDLRAGRLDLALAGLTGGPAAGLESHVVTDGPLAAYVAPGHPLASRQGAGLADLREWPVLTLPRGTGVRTALDAGCATAGIGLRIAVEAGDPLVLAAFAARGLGVAILPRSAFADVTAVALSGAPLRSRMALVWRGEGPVSPAARALREHLRATLPRGAPRV